MKNKIKKTFKEKLSSVKGWFFKRGLTITCCALIVSLGTVFLVWSSPGATHIGENISTGNITASGNLEISGNATTTGNFTVSGTTTLATTTISGLAGDLDLNQYQLKEAVLERLSDFPSNATTGQMFWSTATDTPYWYTGSRWKGDVSGATFVVAASDSLNKEKADYVCDGTDDQVEIQAAINNLGTFSQWDNADSIDNWSNIGGTIEVDGAQKEGTGCFKMVPNLGGSSFRAQRLVLDEDWTEYDVLTLWVKSEEAGITRFEIDFYDNAGGHLYTPKIYIAQANTWKKVVFSLPTGDFDWSHVMKLYVYCWLNSPDIAFWVDDIQVREEGKGKVMLMEGSYSISASIDLVSHSSIEGQGPTTHLTSTADVTNIFYGIGRSRNISIKNMLLDGNNTGPSSKQKGLIYIASASDILVENVYAQRSTSSGINIHGCDHVTVRGCFASDNFFSGIRVCTSDYSIITGNRSYDNAYGIGLCCPRYAICTNNQVKGSKGLRGGIWIGNYYRDNYNVLIAGNIIDGQGLNPSGIQFIGDGGNEYDLSNVQILNNIIVNTGEGIGDAELYGYGSDTAIYSDIQIHNNLFSGNTYGIRLREKGTIEDLSVKDNRFSDNTTNISIDSNISNTVVKDNVGYATENSGTTTISANTTSTPASHGLVATSTKVWLTPTTDTMGKRYWVDQKTSSSFRVNLDSTSTQDIIFDWRAVTASAE